MGSSADVRVIRARPSILLQAVVELGERTKEGHLIEAVAPAWFEIAKMIEKDPSAMYQIADRKWEELIAAWYKAYGFDEVILTPRSGDLGRDVIAIKRGILSVRIIDQVKAFSPGRLVSANDVRALLGVLGSDRAASKGLVTTTSDFAAKITEDELIAPYLPTRLELVNGAGLVTRLADVAKKQ
ncbi:MAG TPA: restriction endonuclease [Gemmataceae bacterium]|nr:restriction endonuclease [Gemmataceae bacterium]